MSFNFAERLKHGNQRYLPESVNDEFNTDGECLPAERKRMMGEFREWWAIKDLNL
jgi:hypothetical protein